MKKLITLITCIVILVLGVILYCFYQSKDNGTLTKVKVAEVTHSVFYAPQYAAITQGFFEEEGLKLEITTGQGADKVMTSILAGQSDIGLCGPEASIYVYNEGKEDYCQVFAQMTKKDGSFLVARNENKDFDWQEVKGKTIIPGRKGGVPYMTLEYVIKNNGMNPSEDMNFDNSISFDAMTAAFVGGVGDYVTIFEPTATELELEGKVKILASVGEVSGEIPYTVYFANKNLLSKNPEFIQNFVDALYEGQVWVAEHTDLEVAQALVESFPGTSVEILEKVVARYRSIDAWNTTPVMSEEAFNRLQDVIEEAGELDKRVSFEALVDNTYARKAVEK